MACEGSPLLSRYNSSLKYSARSPSSFTLNRFLEYQGWNEGKLKEMADQISPEVYRKFSNLRSNGLEKSFSSFLVNNCCSIPDALTSRDYSKARDDSERKEVLKGWVERFEGNQRERPRNERVISFVPATAQPVARTNESVSEMSPAVAFYSEYFARMDGGARLVSHDRVVQKEAKNIVVQPKFEDYPTDIAKIYRDSISPESTDEEQTLFPIEDGVSIHVSRSPSKKPGKKTQNPSTVKSSPKSSPKKSTTPSIVKKILSPSHPKTKPLSQPNIKIVVKRNQVDSNEFDDLEDREKVSRLPRNTLESLSNRMRDAMIDSPDMDLSSSYRNVMDVSHSGFDIENESQLRDAMNTIVSLGFEHLAKKEKRDLLDLFNRGAPSFVAKVEKNHPQACAIMRKNLDRYHAEVDEDIVNILMANQEVLDSIDEGNNTFVLGHDEIPALRYLHNQGHTDALKRFVSSNKVRESGNGANWSPELSRSPPTVSDTGKSKVFASSAFKDRVTYFKKWANDCGCEKQVFLAPTDGAIVSSNAREILENGDMETKRNFVMSHAVSQDYTKRSDVIKMAKKEMNWKVDHLLTNGEIGMSPICTNISVDPKTKTCFIPINKLLCSV